MVSEPDIESGSEAKEFCQELQRIFRELEIADAEMQKGQMRCEVNVSISDNDKLGTKVEIKNLNSFKTVEKSIDYEIIRQSKLLNTDKKIIQETRGWNENNGETFSQRIKEGSADYRYFPEPDLPPLNLTKIDIEKLKRELPELPQEKRQRFKRQYGFKSEDAKILTSNPALADYTENVVSELKNWLDDIPEIEVEADKMAEKALIPSESWSKDSSEYFGSEGSIDELRKYARKLHIHESILAGRIQHDTGNYRRFRQLLGNGVPSKLFGITFYK